MIVVKDLKKNSLYDVSGDGQRFVLLVDIVPLDSNKVFLYWLEKDGIYQYLYSISSELYLKEIK